MSKGKDGKRSWRAHSVTRTWWTWGSGRRSLGLVIGESPTPIPPTCPWATASVPVEWAPSREQCQGLHRANKMAICLTQRLVGSGEGETGVTPVTQGFIVVHIYIYISLYIYSGKTIKFYYYCYCIFIMIVTERSDQSFCPQLRLLRWQAGPRGHPARKTSSAVGFGAITSLFRAESADRPLCLSGRKDKEGKYQGKVSYYWKVPCHMRTNGI